MTSPAPIDPAQYCVFDIETCSVHELFKRADFVRLVACTHMPPTTDTLSFVTHLMSFAQAGGTLVGHRTSQFDLIALARWHGLDLMPLRGKIIDTLILEQLLRPVMSTADLTKEEMAAYRREPGYGLDALATMYGVPGKTHDLAKLAKRWVRIRLESRHPGQKITAVMIKAEMAATSDGYAAIPIDCPDYRAYLAGDIAANTAVFEHQRALIGTGGRVEQGYVDREMVVALIMAQVRLNGFAVDVPELLEELERQAVRKAEKTSDLCTLTGFTPPAGAKAPFASNAGKEAVRSTLRACGIPAAHIPTTPKTGALATGRKALAPLVDKLTEHGHRLPDAEKALNVLSLLTQITSERSVYGTLDKYRIADMVHPQIDASQASARWSVTDPGLTVLGKHEGRSVERRMLIARPGHVLVTIDLKQADPRVVAGLSQCANFMAIFIEDRDVHGEVAVNILGGLEHRKPAKGISNGYMYGLGAEKMIANGADPVLVHRFFEMHPRVYPGFAQWQTDARTEATTGTVIGGWGRRMRSNPNRAYTQGTALPGQNGTAELMRDGLVKMDDDDVRAIKTVVHDELVTEVESDDGLTPSPSGQVRVDHIAACLTQVWRGVPITVDVSKPGRSWADCC